MSIPKFQVQRNLTPTSTIAISGSPDYVGTYGSGTTYATGDVVTYNGSSYVARQATTGNTPGETAYWQTLASQGNTGAQGPTGAQGAAGAAGAINTVTAGTNLNGGGSSSTVTVNLDSSISLTSATFSAGSPLIFEGATPDAHETTIAVTDPTGDRTVTIPDGSGTVAYLDSNITGNAATATTATTATNVTATANNTADETVYLTFVDGATGSQGVETDTGLNYNPSSGVLTTTSVTGNLTGNVTGNTSGTSGSTTGNAATATEATNVTATANNTANETVYLTFVDGATGTQGIETDTGLNYNPSTGVLTTTSVTGNLTGNVTGNTSGSSGSTTGNAATATALASARNIGGVSFDGTGNIDLPGVNAAGNQNTSGNAATATALATARAINGVNFDGTGAITVTAAAGTLSGGTLASGVTASSLTSVGTLGSLTVTGDATFDTSTLKVDSSNNRVGIGKTDPATALDVVGTIDSTVNPPPIVETFASQSISASGTTVTFTSSRFASAPNVMVTQANSGGGASKVPNVDNITASSCRVFLLNTSNSFVAGDASLLVTLEV